MCKPVGPVSTYTIMGDRYAFYFYFYIGLHTGEVSACAMLRNLVAIIKIQPLVFNRLKKKRYQNLEYIWEHDHVYFSYKFVLGNYVTIDYNLFWHIIKYLSITTIERHSEIRHIFGKWRGEIEERISRGSQHRGRIIEACLQYV